MSAPAAYDADTLARHGLASDEYARIVKALGREPTLTERFHDTRVFVRGKTVPRQRV